MIDKRKIYQDALKKYGVQLQLIMFMEELAELTQRISKKIRKPKYPILPILEEMADVENMIDQFKNDWGAEDKVAKIKMQKLYRLKSRLKKL
jgi:hypothetical protein